jgi:hypothetical protein
MGQLAIHDVPTGTTPGLPAWHSFDNRSGTIATLLGRAHEAFKGIFRKFSYFFIATRRRHVALFMAF